MLELISAITLAVLAAVISGLIRVYSGISARELSRRSREGDHHAQSLHLVAKYGPEILLVFWPLALILTSVSLVIFASLLDPWAFVLVAILEVAIIYLIIPRLTPLPPIAFLAEKISPRLARALATSEPVIKPIARLFVNKTPKLTKIYTKEDLRELLSQQRESPENRIEDSVIDMIVHLLRAKGKNISSITVPLESTKVVSADDEIGPILINELHQTKQTYFAVREPKKKNIIGTFFIGDLQARMDGGKVKDVMIPKLYYVNEAQGVEALLDAFIKTKSHVFLVIDENQKILGVVDIESALKKLLGFSFDEYFDQYESPEEVSNPSRTDEDKV